MPIRIPDQLPARDVLAREGVMVMDDTTALRQDIRPLQIGLLNLMPNKIKTETQIARLIGSTPLQVELTLVRVGGHQPKNTPEEHLISFYQTWDEVKHRKFDGFIITGAPIETLPFEEVTYWDELTRILDWTETHVHSTFNICWGAMAAIWHFHGVPKYTLPKKAFGVYRHRNLAPASPLSCRLFRRLPDFGVALDGGAQRRHHAGHGAGSADGFVRDGPLPDRGEEMHRLYNLQPRRIDSTTLAEDISAT